MMMAERNPEIVRTSSSGELQSLSSLHSGEIVSDSPAPNSMSLGTIAKHAPANASLAQHYGDLEDLPSEIRIKIWTYVLDINSTVKAYTQHKKLDVQHKDVQHEEKMKRTAILRVSRAIYNETIHTMFTTNRFILSLTLAPKALDDNLYSLDLYPLKEDQPTNKKSRSFGVQDPFLCDIGYAPHRMNMDKIDGSLLQNIRYLVLDLADARGAHAVEYDYTILNTYVEPYVRAFRKKTLAAVEFINKCTCLRLLQIDIHMGNWRSYDTTKKSHLLLEDLEGLRGVKEIVAKARCELCSEDHDHETGHCYIKLRDHQLSDEYTQHLHEAARKPLGCAFPTFEGIRFIEGALLPEWDPKDYVPPVEYHSEWFYIPRYGRALVEFPYPGTIYQRADEDVWGQKIVTAEEEEEPAPVQDGETPYWTGPANALWWYK